MSKVHEEGNAKCLSSLSHERFQAHFPSSAMIAAPRNVVTIINANRLLSFVRRRSNRKSLASSSTRPVYIRIPALIESSTPLTTLAVKELGLYVVRSPRPMAMEMGVVRPYAAQRSQGSADLGAKGIADMRAPMPRPSKDWWNTRTT